ncbi:hypothetical protein PV328_003396 [Microctonus aethiopoides]|uniref:EGF-like domain-containing protein n=1 Tax=Microctonus aethiopoides TaxID=144406 RepID=A0AA39F8B3_9HYME|nr:hypothetical protein PV328_003396 [Microctonus aethiopoides]
MTTVLLVSARPGYSNSPIGLLAKTARTFVQDGASTEYATQVVGTTLDNGRVYAQILSTSSRVFYEKDTSSDSLNLQSSKISPYVVYPSRVAPQDEWKLFGGVIEDDSSAGKREEAVIRKEISLSSSSSSSADARDRENDIFEIRKEYNVDIHPKFKPAKVRAGGNLPTYTVKQELIGGYNTDREDVNGEEEPRSFRPRVPKIFKPQSARVTFKKEPPRPLNTVTYHGFADFTTIVGDTVIVFSPSTAPAPIGRAATTIKGDATLRPGDGSVVSIQPTSVVQNHQTADPLLDAINGHTRTFESNNLTPSIVEQPEESSSANSTPSLLLPDMETLKPTGLLKVIDSTTSAEGTTTHYKSLIYGTYVGTNYAQIIHTSSNVYYFPDETTAAYDTTTTRYEDETEETITLDSETTTVADETLSPENNELMTPLDETTENSATTIKVSYPTPLEPEILNDINDVQGRSIKGGSGKNDINKNDKKISFSTRLLPSTVYKTFTFYTTFFIPDETNQDHTTTSIKSQEVISSEVSYLTELIVPTATSQESVMKTSTSTSSLETPLLSAETPPISKLSDTKPKQEEKKEIPDKPEEIEVIFKTLYTTYTYLTTFFQESTSSVSSREVVETNVVTQTLGPDGIPGDVAGLFDDDDVTITPTKIQDTILPTTLRSDTTPDEESVTNEMPTTMDDSTTETSFTTLDDQENVKTTIEDNFDGLSQLEPSPSPSVIIDIPKFETKTYFTTFTYFKTFFDDDDTEIETSTQVVSNVVTEEIEPTSVVKSLEKSSIVSTTPKSEPKVSPEILAYLEAIKKQKSHEEALKLAKKVQETAIQEKSIPTTQSNNESTTTTTTPKSEIIEQEFTDGEVLGSMITDVISSSSSSDGTVLEPPMDKRNVGSLPEDQELSESNHHDVEPAPTLLLRTSYTTFTYFTTMYKGDTSNVASRLETVTNVVTETIRPTPAVEMPVVATSVLPVTYFTTFTYWTTFYKAGDTITTSREETVSNVVIPTVSPTPTVELGVIMTYRPDSSTETVEEDNVTDKAIADNEVMMHEKSTTPIDLSKEIIYAAGQEQANIDVSTINPEPTTYYTTFTYFTTSYIGNETILNSRLETITSVALGDIPKATGRAIGTPVSRIQELETEEKVRTSEIIPTKIAEEPKTGLLSTLRSSQVADGTTTHFATDVYGTYIDGLYAQLVQSTTSLETPMLITTTTTPVTSTSSATPALPTGVLSLNKGSIIDADEVTTIFFATSQIGTLIDGLYAKVIESTSSTKVDTEKKATLKPPENRHRTGLVRLIKGQIEADGSTVVYQSKVIGTSIEGRYAQIIESTSSYLLSTTPVLPTVAATATLSSGLPAPTPAVIQSSKSGNNDEQDESNEENKENTEDDEEEEDENGQKAKKKSRLTFSSRKRPFTLTIKPFLLRSRPAFNPKRKGAQGATTITRTDITPTVTATLAGNKGNRFASSRSRPLSQASTTTSINASRRFPGRRVSLSVTPTVSLTSSARGRASVRTSASPTFSNARRGPSSIRGSSARPAVRGSSTIHPGASTRFRGGGIRPSSTLIKPLQTINPFQGVKSDDQEDEANEFTTTTLVTDETPYPTDFEDFEDIGTTTPPKTTTESPRRATNPLLRFRRPLNLAPASRGTSRKTTTTTKAPTVAPRSSNSRSLNNPTLPPIASRSRNNNRFFPPRNFINQRQSEPIEESSNPDERGTHLDDERVVDEIVDNDYEGSENNKRRRTVNRNDPTSTTPRASYGNRYIAQRRRYRRQVSQPRSYQPSRYRRPGSKITSAEDRSDIDVLGVIAEEDFLKPITRYNSRGRSLSTSRPPTKNSAEKYSSESGENAKSRIRRPTTTPRVKPSPTSTAARQFTLREKNSPSYKRTPNKQDNLRRSGTRVRSTTRRPTDPTYDSRRGTSSRSSSRSRTNGRRVPQRNRVGSREDLRDYGYGYGREDGTITVTHYVPTEVTIPVVSNGATEHRNIITASPSIEILGPDRYSTVSGGDGRPLVVIATESSSLNAHGQTEVTRFLLHSTPTSRVSHTLTTIGGRRVSQSLIVPSTVYSVENVISTIPASLPDSNSPLANILLSQLLLGQFGQPNALLGGIPSADVTPTTRYDTRTTTYVTTITKERSTVIPLTFRGKEILTTLIDSSSDIVTATEFITDTVVVTPTAILPAANLNSLLLLLKQPAQAPILSQDPLFGVAPIFTQSNSLPGEVERRHQPADLDYRPDDDSSASIEEFDAPVTKPRVKSQKKEPIPESSVITIYVSGKRPGEFSTILSTVKVGEDTVTTSRRRRDTIEEVRASIPPSLHGQSSIDMRLSPSEEYVNSHTPTQSLESVVDDTIDIINGQHYLNDGQSQAGNYFDGIPDEQMHNKRRKVIRVRVPSHLSREKSERQHKYTVVRKRPLVPYTRSLTFDNEEPSSLSPRRIVVTRIRSLGARSRHFSDNEEDVAAPSYFQSPLKRHKVTVTRTRKLGPTLDVELNKTPRTRVTRKKLVTVRPVVTSTPTFAIITTGFYGIIDHDDENEEDENNEEIVDNMEKDIEESSENPPTLVGSLNDIEEKPEIISHVTEDYQDFSEFQLNIAEEVTTTSNAEPIIITDNFFFPASSEEDEELLEDENISTTEQNFDEYTPMQHEIQEIQNNNKELVSITNETTAENIESTSELFSPTLNNATEESTSDTTTQLNISSNEEEATQGTTTEPSTSEQLTEPSTFTSSNNEEIPTISNSPPITESNEELSVVPLESFLEIFPKHSSVDIDMAIPSVIPLESSMTRNEDDHSPFHSTEALQSDSSRMTTTLVMSSSPEDIEAGLSDELYLSLSRPDFAQISPSRVFENKPNNNINESSIVNSVSLQNDQSPIILYTETVVTSTRLKTYTYVVTKVNGLNTEVTSSTTVRPRVTTLTLTVPVIIAPTSTSNMESMTTNTVLSASHRVSDAAQESTRETRMMNGDGEEEGRRLNLATRIMSNGVEVIVAGPTPALRWENSNPHPTLTLSDAVVMLMPQEDPNEFVTKTCTTTFTYLNTITKDGTTIVSTDQQVVANTATEERHRKPGSESAAVTLQASPTLRTEVFKTTYTYLTLNTDHPDVDNALSSSQKIITNTVTAPQHYLDMFLEPSEVPPPQTNTYLSTRVLEKTFIEDGLTRIGTMSDTITRLIITESALPPPRPTSVTTTLTALDNSENLDTDIMKTYYITYTYYNTYLEKGSNTVVRTNVATSTDIAVEKVPKKTSVIDTQETVTQTSPEPIKIFATKTYLTTFTYFTTLLQAGADGETSTTISSRSHIVENVVTESIAPSLLNAGYMNILTTSHHSDSVKNVVTGSTIIFFDEEDQIDSSNTDTQIKPTTSSGLAQATIENSVIVPVKMSEITAELQNDEPEKQNTSQNQNESDLSAAATSNHEDPPVAESDNASESSDGTPGRPVSSGLLNFGSLGINSLSALGPVITAMADLLKGKPSTTRRNDTVSTSLSATVTHQEPQEVTSQRSPIYIPVAEFADGDIEAAESQNIAAQLANLNPNFLPETRHKIAASIVDGIPISPGEIITANSDVIIGKPGILSPRPPQTYSHNENDDHNIGMKPPPISVPNIPVHPVLEVIRDDGVAESTDPIQHIVPATNPKRPPSIPLLLHKEPVRNGLQQDILENDPLLKPPGRPNIEKYANPNINHNEPEWISDRFRRPWNSKEALKPPPAPTSQSHLQENLNDYAQDKKPWAPHTQNEHKQHPSWMQPNPIVTNVNLESSEPTKPEPIQSSEPIIHQIPHVIDRSTGEPLLVNIQPSQVANVVIPDSGTQVLIFGDTSEPHKSGQYFDEPSPYPESQVTSNFGGFEQGEKNPADYMIPPAPPAINFKPLPQKSRPHNNPIANTRPHERFPPPHEKIEIPANSRPGKRPSDILLLQRPDSHGQSSQGQVHTEILVHHSSDTTNLHLNSNPQLNQHQPPRRQYQTPSTSYDQPPRRNTDISSSLETPAHHHNLHHHGHHHEKSNRTQTSEMVKQQKWKNDRIKQRLPINRPRPPVRLRPNLYPDRTSGYPSGKPRYPPQRPSQVPQAPHPPQIPINWQDEIKNDHSANVNYHQDGQEAPGNLPIGAIGYRNPLIANMKKPLTLLPAQATNYQPHPAQHHQVHQLPPDISPPEIQSFGQILPRPDEPDVSWSETQTEAGPDSSAEETEEHVKYHDQISHSHQHTEQQEHSEEQPIDKYDQDDSIQHAENEEHEVYVEPAQTKKPYENVDMTNVIFNKPVEENQSVSYNNHSHTQMDNHQNSSVGIENSPEYHDDNFDITTKDNEKISDEESDHEIIEEDSFGDRIHEFESKPYEADDTIDLKPPAISSQFPPQRPTRPRPSPSLHRIKPTPRPSANEAEETLVTSTAHPPGGHARPPLDWENSDISHNNNDNNNRYPGRRNLTSSRPNLSQNPQKKPDSKYIDTEIIRNSNSPTQTSGTRIHLTYPHIVTKPRPKIPLPVTISTGSSSNQKRLQMKEKNNIDKSSTVVNRPINMRPSLVIHVKDKNRETLETAYQTNFASNENKDDTSNDKRPTSSKQNNNSDTPKTPSQDMMPPPPTKATADDKSINNKDDGERDLKPPPMPSDVVGMSPPPIGIKTTTTRPGIINTDESGLKPPPPKYIPLTDSSKVIGETPPPPPPPPPPSLPSANMVPPTVPRPTKPRPLLMELLSQDMVPPPPPLIESSRPIEISTVRPAIAVSGSIQIATAVAINNIPVMQDNAESTIPIIHGTVDLPVVMDVSDIMKSVETRKPEHVSIYTVRPFETRKISRVSVQPTTILSTNLIMPTRLRIPQIDLTTSSIRSPIQLETIPSYEMSKNPSVILEASRQSISSDRMNPTQSLNHYISQSTTPSIHPDDVTFTSTTKRKYGNSFTKSRDSILKTTKKFVVAPTGIYKNARNVTTTTTITTLKMKPKAVTHFKTLTVTRTETSVVGSPPTTRTLLLTHTLTSRIIETVTETLLRPTNVVITSVTTILQPATRLPTYDNSPDNVDSIFVVMSDQNPPAADAEEVEAEYGGEEEITRDEQDPSGNEIHRILSGSVLGASIIPHQPPVPQCQPECRASKSEMCSQVGGEPRCICRPGFARMFPDRPCKPTYTYTLRIGLDRIGRESIKYEHLVNNTTSPSFRKLAGPTREALDRTLMQSDLRDVYRGLDIAGFHPNPAQVEFHVQLSDNTSETRLKDIVKKYLLSSNYSLGGTEVFASKDFNTIDAQDFDECSTEEGGPHHDCSPHATCFNLRGSYQCSCKEGWADVSENSAYPGRICSQAPLGCAGCNNKGHCVTNSIGQEVCECFPWHSGQRCQVNLKVLLIALVTAGAILLGLLGVCLALACFRHPGKAGKSGDRRAMIASGTGGDTSSEGSVTDLAIPHHVPHVLPPPPRSVAPAPPNSKRTKKTTSQFRSPKKPSYTGAPLAGNEMMNADRSLSVMIPRAKYRSGPQSPQNYSKPPMSTFAADEHKLINYLEGGPQIGNRKASVISTSKEYHKNYDEPALRAVRNAVAPNNGALVSAGFQVSATVMRTGDGESMLDDTLEPSTMKTLRSTTDYQDGTSTLARSCDATTIQATTKLLPLDLTEAESSVGHSCGDDTSNGKHATPSRGSKDTRDARDSASEGPITAERDLGSTLRLRHPPLYNPERAASDRDSNFDSL